ncbi:MAG: hypothetical protein Q9217_000286, partial [Psora testacea]
PTFHKAKHIKYWLRCLKTLLPTAYTSNDSQRMTFAFFTLSALDLLDALYDHTTADERQGYADWIYRCQHPGGGFRGFTGAKGGNDVDQEGNCWDPANLAATFFALAALIVLGDGMDSVRARECLEWVRRLQRSDGSFGEAIGKGGVIEGGGDIRYCYLAAGVRWVLRRAEMERAGDIDVEGLVGYVGRSVTYEGGIAQAPFHEAHAGCTYCGVGVLKLLGRLPTPGDETKNEGLLQNVLRWLVYRQTLYLLEDDDFTMVGEDLSDLAAKVPEPPFQMQAAYPVPALDAWKESEMSSKVSTEAQQCAGFNGRCNKMLRKPHLQDFNAIRNYLLGKTQHVIGGFGKMCGDPPDILHSYLGLAALATIHEPELRSTDPTLCISMRAREDFEQRTTVPTATKEVSHLDDR